MEEDEEGGLRLLPDELEGDCGHILSLLRLLLPNKHTATLTNIDFDNPSMIINDGKIHGRRKSSAVGEGGK